MSIITEDLDFNLFYEESCRRWDGIESYCPNAYKFTEFSGVAVAANNRLHDWFPTSTPALLLIEVFRTIFHSFCWYPD